MSLVKKAYLDLHFAVLLFGLTAILGAKIQLPAIVLIWWRLLIAALGFLALTGVWSSVKALPRNTILRFMGIGVIVMIHWLCFYGAIKWANASIALACLATTSLFSSFLEPLLTRQRIKWYEVGLSLLVIPGMILIKNQTKIEMLAGFWLGLLSALLAALFSILNKKAIARASPTEITFLELIGGWLALNLFFPLYYYFYPEAVFLPAAMDWVYLLILSLLCTTLAFTLATQSLKHISAFASNLTINMEPVYGIIMAWLILGENRQLSANFYIGGGMIVFAVLMYPALSRKP